MTQSIEPIKLYKLEEHLNDWVKKQFAKLQFKNQIDYFTGSAIPVCHSKTRHQRCDFVRRSEDDGDAGGEEEKCSFVTLL